MDDVLKMNVGRHERKRKLKMMSASAVHSFDICVMDRPTKGRTEGHDLLQMCVDANKKETKRKRRPLKPREKLEETGLVFFQRVLF